MLMLQARIPYSVNHQFKVSFFFQQLNNHHQFLDSKKNAQEAFPKGKILKSKLSFVDNCHTCLTELHLFVGKTYLKYLHPSAYHIVGTQCMFIKCIESVNESRSVGFMHFSLESSRDSFQSERPSRRKNYCHSLGVQFQKLHSQDMLVF